VLSFRVLNSFCFVLQLKHLHLKFGLFCPCGERSCVLSPNRLAAASNSITSMFTAPPVFKEIILTELEDSTTSTCPMDTVNCSSLRSFHLLTSSQLRAVNPALSSPLSPWGLQFPKVNNGPCPTSHRDNRCTLLVRSNRASLISTGHPALVRDSIRLPPAARNPSPTPRSSTSRQPATSTRINNARSTR
jgi:hypothetical protein